MSKHGLDRRTFVAGAAGIAIGAAGSHFLSPAIAPTVKTHSFSLPYKIYTTGREGRRFKGSHDIYRKLASVVTELDLRTGEIRQTAVPVREAHNAFVLPAADTIFITPQHYRESYLLDLDMGHKNAVISPEGYVFSGHGVTIPDQNVLLVTLYRIPEGPDIEGMIIAYDIKTMAEVGRYRSGGVRPHDMVAFSDGKHLALAHAGDGDYGDMAYDGADTVAHPPEFYLPKLTIINVDTMQTVKTMDLEDSPPLIHLTVDADDNVYAVLQEYIGYQGVTPEAKDNVRDKITQHFGPELPFSLNELEIISGSEGIAIPHPLIHFDTRNDSIHKIFTGAANQRRSQSVAHVAQTGMVVAGYVFSETLLCVPKDGEPFAMETPSFGIQYPIALCEVPGTPYLAVGGIYDDVAILDTRDMSVVHTYHHPLYRSSHFTPLAV